MAFNPKRATLKTPSELLQDALPLDAPAASQLATWLPVRTLSDHHRGRILEHLLALDEADRQLRFGHTAHDEQIRHYVAHMNLERDEVLGVFDDRLKLVAMAHLAFDAESEVAEFGVSVLAHVRGRGIGARLFQHAVTHARNRGASAMTIHLARENTAMLAIVRKAGAAVRFDAGDVEAQLELPADTLGSQIEALLESQAADLDYRVKMHVLRLDRLLPGLVQPAHADA